MSGHMFALANQFDVEVYCSVKFEKMFTYKGHSNTVNVALHTRTYMYMRVKKITTRKFIMNLDYSSGLGAE